MQSQGIESRKTRLARMVLILLLLSSMSAANLLTFTLAFAPKPVPVCHGHHHLPSPEPADHLCCAVGHEPALVTRVVSVESPPTTLALVLRSPLTLARSEPRPKEANLNPSPPTPPPLRI